MHFCISMSDICAEKRTGFFSRKTFCSRWGSSPLQIFYALLYLYVGYLCGKANRLFFPEDILLPLGVIAAADICVSLVCYIIMFFMRARLDIGYYILHVILPEAVYTIVVAFIFYPLLLFLHKRMLLADRGSTE